MKYLCVLFVLVFLLSNISGVSKRYGQKYFIDPCELGEGENHNSEKEKETEKNGENLFELSGKSTTIPNYNPFDHSRKKYWVHSDNYLTKEIIISIFNPPEYLS